MIMDLTLKDSKGQDHIILAYDSKDGSILLVKVWNELADDFVKIEIETKDSSNLWFMKQIQQVVDKIIHERATSISYGEDAS